MRLFPSVQRVLRWWLYWTHEARLPAFLHAGWLTRLAASVAQKHLETQVTNPDLRKKLTPNYNFGCKRVLVSDDFYAAVSRPNCEIVSEGIAAVTSNGVQTQGGTLHPLDVLVFGTGFQVSDPLGTIRVVGRNGQSLSNAWASGAHAWFGTGMVGFPNFFMITGPNTGLGHNSMVFMIESQLAFVTKTIDIVQNTGAKWWEVRDDAERDFNEHLRRKLSKTVWLSGCRSWYLDERGNNIALWPGFTFAFRAGLSRFDKRVHHLEGVST
jgi:cation diffusion facilitator CzcD-associated flavoprotein CzcO